MSCTLCFSPHEVEFSTEMMIHFKGRKHLVNPGVLAFPKMVLLWTLSYRRVRKVKMFALDPLFHEFGHAVRKILSGSRTRWAGEHPGTSGRSSDCLCGSSALNIRNEK